MSRLELRKHGRGHSYRLDGEKIDGATTILNALPKQLTQWAADCSANFAVENWDELAGETLVKRIDRIRYAHRDVVSAAALRGTRIHAFGERLVSGDPVEIPDEYRTPSEAYARFLDEWKIEPIATETPVAHLDARYGGTADLWGTIGVRDGARALIDLKTGKGVYESAVLQLAAYRFAQIWQPDGADSEESLPEVDAVYVAHILPDAVRMLPVTAGEAEFRQFRYVQVTSQWLSRHGYQGDEPLIGDAELAIGGSAA
jgi:hypothetical protein